MKKIFSITLSSAMLTFLRMISGFIIAKMVAKYTGPSGMAMLGQVQSLVGIINGIVAAPTGNSIIHYTAKYSSEGYDACAPWWKAVTRWLVGLITLTVPFAIITAMPLAEWLFGSTRYYWIVIVSVLTLPLSTANTLLSSVINGQQQHKRYIILGMLSVFIATCLMLVLIACYGLNGSLLATTLFSAISGCIMIAGSLHQPWFKLRYWWGQVDQEQIKSIGRYVLMAITSTICMPFSLILIRNILIAQVGLEQAGQWQAVYKISEVYLSVITMALGTYYLPRLATLNEPSSIHTEMMYVVKIIMPIVTLLALGVYLLRDFIITILFTEQFRAAGNLFAVQLTGDVIKILSWIFVCPMLAHGASKWFISTEIIFSCSLVILTLIFVNILGTQGANIAYTINYFCYAYFSYINSPYKNLRQ